MLPLPSAEEATRKIRTATVRRVPYPLPLPALPCAGEGLRPGVQHGPYEVLTFLAAGGMASVWVARQRLHGGHAKLVALKTLRPELATDEAARRRFAEESRVTARIRHPNVCGVYELVEERGILALPMEWIDGASLTSVVSGLDSPLDARLAARIVALAASGLHAAHQVRDEQGRPLELVHRDISPQNILIARSGQVKLTDFGIAKVAYHSCEPTFPGQVKGTVGYMSPEQARGLALDARSDVFSLGAVLYFAALGKRPFRQSGESRSTSIRRLLRGEYVRPRDVDPQLPRGFAELVERALMSDPRDRFQSAEEMRMAIEDWLRSSDRVPTQQDVASALARSCGNRLAQREQAICLALGLPREPAQSHPSCGSETLAVPVPPPLPVRRMARLFGANAEGWSSPRLVLGIGLTMLLALVPVFFGGQAVRSEAPSRGAAARPAMLSGSAPARLSPPYPPAPPCSVTVQQPPRALEDLPLSPNALPLEGE